MEVALTALGILVLIAWIVAGIAVIACGMLLFRRHMSWMVRSLALLLAALGGAYLILLVVALILRWEPWSAMLAILIVGVVLAALIFWVSVLADCLLNEPNEGMGKLVWVLAIVLTFVVGAAIYYFGRRPRRLLEKKQ